MTKTPMLGSPPMRALEDYVHFDTEVISKDSEVPFFQDARRFFHDGLAKTLDVDTNLRSSDSLSSSPCEKQISSVRIVTPAAMKVRFVFAYGADPVVDQVLETNVDHDLKRNVGIKMFRGTGLGPLVETENFGVTVTGINGSPCRARVEIKGRFTVQDFENPAWAEWHSRLVDELIQGHHFTKMKARAIGQGRGDGLFDTEIAWPGLTRFFIDARRFSDGTPKEYGATVLVGGAIKDTNVVGNGCSLPRGYVLNATNVTVEEKEFSSGLKEPVKVSIVTAMGHVLASTIAKPREVTSIGPVWSVGCEEFEVRVEQTTYSGKLRVLLGGEIYKPDMT